MFGFDWASKIINDIHYILLPQVCFGCNAPLYRGEHLLCTVCRHDLPITDYNFKEENEIDRIFYGRVRIEKAAALLYFSKTGIVKNLIHNLKYKNQEQIGEFLGNWYGQLINERQELSSIDVVIPVPLHPKKQRQRGYNQVALFGKQLATHLNAQYLDHILVKTANTKTQTKKSRLNRWASSQDLFDVVEFELLRDKTVLLVDDIITTGATIEACALALQKIKNIKVYVATMAAVPKLMN
ncbi:MAG: ComF family protein [Croceitalea sp.]|nr:ComF family protein [Croceitalea sp.]NNL10073.1 ComF family protein [Croceitalea sp.]NNM19360.1 ComF family protein [Croceitalea sp.]